MRVLVSCSLFFFFFFLIYIYIFIWSYTYVIFFFFLRYARWLRLRLLFFFCFIFLFAFLRCVHIHLLQIFLFLLNVLVLNARTVFTVLRIHGILEWLDCCLPTLMLVSLIHEKSYRWWSHSSNDDIFFLFSFFSFAKIQTRLPSAFAVQFSTWIKKTVHVSRPFYYSFFFPSFWNFQTPERIISPALSVLYPNSKRKESEILLVNDKSGDSSL